jgi:FkbM family methyltransferase
MATMNKQAITRIDDQWTQGANVPGGFHAIINQTKPKPFIPNMRECNSIELRHSDVVVDIGAWVGTYAIRCARFPVKQVTAYEPTPRTFHVLNKTKLPNLKQVQAAVVHDDRDTVNFFISSGIGTTNSIAKSNRKLHVLNSPAVNYVDVVRGASIVKIDVEGAEYVYPIIQPSLRAIILEFHHMQGDWRGRAREIIAELLHNGFETIMEPDFDKGWSSAGSWMRPMETEGEYTPMMRGDECCGCGVAIQATSKALCSDCWGVWLPKHREGYFEAIPNG